MVAPMLNVSLPNPPSNTSRPPPPVKLSSRADPMKMLEVSPKDTAGTVGAEGSVLNVRALALNKSALVPTKLTPVVLALASIFRTANKLPALVPFITVSAELLAVILKLDRSTVTLGALGSPVSCKAERELGRLK